LVSGIYLLFFGLPSLMKVPKEQAPAYTIIVVCVSATVSFSLVAVSDRVVSTAAAFF